MGYTDQSGRYVDTVDITLLENGAYDADGNGDAIEVGEKRVACLDLTVSAVSGGTNEIQSLAIDATGGTYTLTFDGQTTAAIAFDATASAVQAALIALSNLATGDVVCTGGPGASAAITITFGGSYAGRNVPAITTTATSLTGGAGTATVTTSTAGVAPTLDVSIATCDTPDGTFRTLGSFTQVTGPDLDDGEVSERLSFSGLDRYVRSEYDLAGASAAFTFSVSGELK